MNSVYVLQLMLKEAHEALNQCADQFTFYADEHEAQGKTEKAETNRKFARIARNALKRKVTAKELKNFATD